MKRLLLITISLFIFSVGFSQLKGFEKGNMYHQLGFGGQNYWSVGSNSNGWGGSWRGWGAGFTTQYQGEWGIHNYVGLGFHAGLTIRPYINSDYLEMYIPVGLQANFHFYQLIDDKVSSDLKSDKLDIYGGINVGGGPVIGIDTYFDDTYIFGGIHAGPQVGVRFYPKSNVGIFAEVGYGKSFAQFGLVIR